MDAQLQALQLHPQMPRSRLPPIIKYPAHPSHPLSLLQTPAYPCGRFDCDVCRLPGHGSCYHCHHCNFDLHVLCASLPLLPSQQSHPHLLQLFFGPPYQKKQFFCDVCLQKMGFNHWLYHCAACKFDAHLNCATNMKPLNQSHGDNGGIKELNQSKGDNGGIGNALASSVLHGLASLFTQSIIDAFTGGNNN